MGKAILVPGADFTGDNLGTITPLVGIPIHGLAIKGPDSVLAVQATYKPMYYPAWTTQKSVVWSIVSGGEYASIATSQSGEGVLTVDESASGASVTIRCTSSSDNTIISEKTITVTYNTGEWVQYDWMQNTGSGYFVLDDFQELYGATIVVRGYITNTNAYFMNHRSQYPPETGQHSQLARFAAYRQTAGKLGVLLGDADFVSTNVTPSGTTIYRWKFVMSTSSSSSNASATLYNDGTNAQLYTLTGKIAYVRGAIYLFASGVCDYGGTPSNGGLQAQGKFYGATITRNGETIAEYVPGTLGGVPVIKNTVTNEYFLNRSSDNSLTVGNN